MLVYSAIDALTGRPRPAGSSVSAAARDTAPIVRPPRLAPHEASRLRAAQVRAKRLYPGPVGELVAGEIAAWHEFGFRLDQHGIAGRLIDHLMTAALPAEVAS